MARWNTFVESCHILLCSLKLVNSAMLGELQCYCMLHWEPLSRLQFVEFLKKTRPLQLNREENDLVLMINGAQCYADPMSHTLRAKCRSKKLHFGIQKQKRKAWYDVNIYRGPGGRREEGGGLFLQSLPWVQMFSSVLTHCSG